MYKVFYMLNVLDEFILFFLERKIVYFYHKFISSAKNKKNKIRKYIWVLIDPGLSSMIAAKMSFNRINPK